MIELIVLFIAFLLTFRFKSFSEFKALLDLIRFSVFGEGEIDEAD